MAPEAGFLDGDASACSQETGEARSKQIGGGRPTRANATTMGDRRRNTRLTLILTPSGVEPAAAFYFETLLQGHYTPGDAPEDVPGDTPGDAPSDAPGDSPGKQKVTPEVTPQVTP